MLNLGEIKSQLNSMKEPLSELKEAVNYDALKNKIDELERKTAEPLFWEQPENSQKVLKEIKRLKEDEEALNSVFSCFLDAEELLSLTSEQDEDHQEVLGAVLSDLNKVEKESEKIYLKTLLTGEYDECSAIISFHPGAGGTDAQDWAQMLYRMYTRYADRHDFKVKVMDYLNGEEAGMKSATILIEGKNAYGFLKSEAGVHRLVRISPFDTSGKRHTSFASIEVSPEIEDESEILIKQEDLKVDTYRASGAGGQHVNKTESAIRITHLPTGIIVACQSQRSQHQNREYAMKMLMAKLAEIKEREHLEKIEDIKGVKHEIAWGSQIRSYVFMPYTLVKDHRTDFETGSISSVMDGDIDDFINAYLKYKSREKK